MSRDPVLIGAEEAQRAAASIRQSTERFAQLSASVDAACARLEAINQRAEELIGRYEAAILEAEDTISGDGSGQALPPYVEVTLTNTVQPEQVYRMARHHLAEDLVASRAEALLHEEHPSAAWHNLPRSKQAEYLRRAREGFVVTGTDLIGFQGAVKPDHYIIEADHDTLNNPDFMGMVVRHGDGSLTWHDNRAVHRESDATFMIYRSRLDQLSADVRECVLANKGLV